MKIVYDGTQDKRVLKDVIGRTIEALLEKDPDFVYLDADLMGCIGTQKLPEMYDRAINCGIAEANMVGTACGLSAAGLHPVVHSFGPFASRRCFDQVFLSGGYAGNSITVIGTDPGICAAFNGGTHMPFEDMALYRTIPGAVVVDITDVPMLEYCLRTFPAMQGVKYIRTQRKGSAQVYEDGTEFTVGKGKILRDGTDCTVIACGIMVHEAMQAAAALEKEGISVGIVDPFTVKPLDTELVKSCATLTGAVVTAENHNRIGGLYSAVKEVLSGEAVTGYVAVEDEFGEVGPQDYLRERFDLTADHIVRVVKETIAKKK